MVIFSLFLESFFFFSESCSFIDRVHVLEDRSLVLENVNLSDEGEYRCEAENVVGSISAVGSLIIQCKFHGKFPCQIKKKTYLHFARTKYVQTFFSVSPNVIQFNSIPFYLLRIFFSVQRHQNLSFVQQCKRWTHKPMHHLSVKQKAIHVRPFFGQSKGIARLFFRAWQLANLTHHHRLKGSQS